MDNIKNAYIDKINLLISRPTIIKFISFNMNDINNLLNDNTFKIYNSINNTTQFQKKIDIIKFIYNVIYIDLSNILNIKPLSFLLKTNIQDFINDDTKKYNEILKLENSKIDDTKQYIYIKNWLNIINTIINNPNAGNNIATLNVLLDHHNQIYSKYIDVCLELLNILEHPNNNNFQGKLNEILQKKVENNILTFIKIRNNDKVQYNKKRFEIKINEVKRQMLIKYNDDNKSYDSKDIITSPDGGYNHKYVLGPFTKIFIPCKKNDEIASEMNDIIDNLIKGNPVFTFGYGASGAGKTSSLIYFNKGKTPEDRNGIILHLCNIMFTKGFSNIEVEFKEFYKEKNDTIIVEQPKKSNADLEKLQFNNKGNGFLLSNEYKHNITHKYRTRNDKNEEETVKVFNANSELGEIMSYLVDTDRFVKATTNNPNSSRSHVLIYVKFLSNKGVNPTLILGDFAGVENSFDCDSKNVQERFKDVKIDNSDIPFYTKYPEFDMQKINKPKELEKFNDDVLSKLSVFSLDKFLKDNFKDTFDQAKDKLITDEIPISRVLTKVLSDTDIVNKKKIPEKDAIANMNNIKADFEKYMKQKVDKKNPTKVEKYITKDQNNKNLPVFKYLYLNLNQKFNTLNLKTILDIIDYIIKIKSEKMNIAKNTCEIRRNEGNMINESLADVNDVIKLILKEKNKDSVDISPEFIDKCLPMYCKNNECFLLSDENNKKISSLIFDSIKSEFKMNDYKNLTNLIISVFCVLNISTNANNPPPIPYIDINDIYKQINNMQFKELQIADIQADMILLKDLLNSYIDKVPELYNQINNTKKLSEFLNKKAIPNSEYNAFIISVKDFLKKIDKSNAASAIGTLQTVDKMAKYNTVDTICSIKDNDILLNQYKINVEC